MRCRSQSLWIGPCGFCVIHGRSERLGVRGEGCLYWAVLLRDGVIESEDSFQRMMANPSMKILHDDFQTYIQDMLALAKKS